MPTQVENTFYQSVQEGQDRLERSWPALLATGAVGGIDVSVGVLAMLVVRQATGSEMLGALAFGLGFVALTLASSELFTENFLIPVTAVVAGKARARVLLRLWVGTLLTNLVGGWVVMGLVMRALPATRPIAIAIGTKVMSGGIGTITFCSAILGGLIITLMTWMERGTESPVAKLIAALGLGFLLAAGALHHAIVISLESFAALHAGAPFGYASWAGMFGWAVAGNLVGGLLLVTVLRLVQVGATTLELERERSGGDAGEHGPVILDVREDNGRRVVEQRPQFEPPARRGSPESSAS